VYIEDDQLTKGGISKATWLFKTTDSIGVQLSTLNNGIESSYSKLNLEFDVLQGVRDLSSYDYLEIDAEIPSGDSVEILLLQSNIINWNFYRVQWHGEGRKNYRVNFEDVYLKNPRETPAFDASAIYGISIRNPNAGVDLTLKIYQISLGSEFLP